MPPTSSTVMMMATELGYDPRWIAFGILSPDEVQAQYAAYLVSDDKSTEHHRAKAFADFFRRRTALSDEELRDYLHIYESSSPDDILKPNHLHELVRFPGLRTAQLDSLARHPLFQAPGLARIVRRHLLLRRLQAPTLERGLVEDVVACGDPSVQRRAMEHPNATPELLLGLCERGAHKEIRRLAAHALHGRP